MARFDNETIRRYAERIAKAFKVIIKCDEFGRNWNIDNKDCQVCKIDSKSYHAKCREFSKGILTGYKPVKIGRPIKKIKRKIKEVHRAKVQNAYSLFRTGTKVKTIYTYLKDKTKIGSLELLMQHVSDTFECDITANAIRKQIENIRKILSRFGHEELKYYRGFYWIERTPKGNRFGNTKQKIELRRKEKEDTNGIHENT